MEAELVGWKPVKDIFGDRGVLKKILVEGTEWERPNEGSKVELVGCARLPDGTVFEEFPEGSELKFTVDEEEVGTSTEQENSFFVRSSSLPFSTTNFIFHRRVSGLRWTRQSSNRNEKR